MNMTFRPTAAARIDARLPKTFREAAESFILRSPNNEKLLRPIIDKIGDQYLDDIAPIDIRDMAEAMYPTQKNATRNRNVLTPVKSVFYHGAERLWCAPLRLRNFKEEPAPKKKAASPEWLALFYRQADRMNLGHIAALVMFMSTTGARVSEALRLQWEDIDFVNRSCILLKTKTSTNSERALTDYMIARLHKLREKARPGRPVFKIINRSDVNKRIEKICLAAEIDYKSSHECGRHAMVNNAIALGLDIKSVMIAGGWTSVQVFVGTYLNPRNAARSVADRFNTQQYHHDI